MVTRLALTPLTFRMLLNQMYLLAAIDVPLKLDVIKLCPGVQKLAGVGVGLAGVGLAVPVGVAVAVGEGDAVADGQAGPVQGVGVTDGVAVLVVEAVGNGVNVA